MSANRSTRSRFVRGLTKMTEAEGSFEEMFSETMRQFPAVYDNGSFSLETRSLSLCLFQFALVLVSLVKSRLKA